MTHFYGMFITDHGAGADYIAYVFYRAMLCISAVYAGTRCLFVYVPPSVCHVRELRQNE